MAKGDKKRVVGQGEVVEGSEKDCLPGRIEVNVHDFGESEQVLDWFRGGRIRWK